MFRLANHTTASPRLTKDIGLLAAIPLGTWVAARQAGPEELSGAIEQDGPSGPRVAAYRMVASAEQTQRIREIEDIYGMRIRKLEAERDAAIEDVLTPSQRATLAELRSTRT